MCGRGTAIFGEGVEAMSQSGEYEELQLMHEMYDRAPPLPLSQTANAVTIGSAAPNRTVAAAVAAEASGLSHAAAISSAAPNGAVAAVAAAKTLGSERPIECPGPASNGAVPAAPAVEAAPARRRKNGKQPLNPDELARAVARAALAEAVGDGGLALPSGARRKCVHYTHVRTWDISHVQPCEMTREAFWRHLERCYAEAYPRPLRPLKSILLFGVVVTERHGASANQVERDEHKHAPIFAEEPHYWNKVKAISLEKYRVMLNAVAHDSYADMYRYVRQASEKKPLSEIDAEPYLSLLHPRNQALSELLAKADSSYKMRHSRQSKRPAATDAEGDGKRARAPVLYDIVKDKNIRTVDQLQAFACAEAVAGRSTLAEYCTRRAGQLQDIVVGAWSVLEAPQRALDANLTLPEKLGHQAVALPCECGGRWIPGAVKVLEGNSISPVVFTGAVYTALQLGAVRGANVACIGKGGCGKSTLIESLELVFKCLEKPQSGSTFPLSKIKQHEVILWQDYDHEEATLKFQDLLSLFVGESVGLRMPCAPNEKFRNTCPCFYSARKPLECPPRQGLTYHDMAELTSQMSERFSTFSFTVPLPFAARDKAFPKCGRCAAAFYLRGQGQPQEAAAAFFEEGSPMAGAVGAQPAWAAAAPAARTATGSIGQSGPAIVDALQRLIALRDSNAIDAEEFALAKKKLLA